MSTQVVVDTTPSSPAGGARGAGRGAGRGRAKFNDPEDIQFIKILKGHDRQITALLIDAANNQASFLLPKGDAALSIHDHPEGSLCCAFAHLKKRLPKG